jgi:hypothetical protein
MVYTAVLLDRVFRPQGQGLHRIIDSRFEIRHIVPV